MSSDTAADTVAASLGGLAAAAADLDEILKTLVTSLDRLRPRIVAACEHWEGDARDAFVHLMADWERQTDDLHERQRWLQEVVATGHRNFTTAHQAVLRG
jgi:WXG100 family type VII secretion target